MVPTGAVSSTYSTTFVALRGRQIALFWYSTWVCCPRSNPLGHLPFHHISRIWLTFPFHSLRHLLQYSLEFKFRKARGEDDGIITVADDMTYNSKIAKHSLNLAVEIHTTEVQKLPFWSQCKSSDPSVELESLLWNDKKSKICPQLSTTISY